MCDSCKHVGDKDGYYVPLEPGSDTSSTYRLIDCEDEESDN